MDNVFGARLLSKSMMVYDVEVLKQKLLADHSLHSQVLPSSITGALEIRVGAISVRLHIHDHAIPGETIDRGDMIQDKGRAEAIEHTSFASVGLVAWPESHAGKLLYIITLCQAMAALLDVLGASAVLWNGSQALVPAEQFREETLRWRADPVKVPLMLLFRVMSYERPMRDGGVGRGLCALGFSSIVGREIEFPPQEVAMEVLVESFELVARWIVLKGLTFKDGDTCGGSKGEVIRLSYHDSGRLVPKPVVLCSIETSARH